MREKLREGKEERKDRRVDLKYHIDTMSTHIGCHMGCVTLIFNFMKKLKNLKIPKLPCSPTPQYART